ncbi:MAG: DUF3144 domain-containing protein [Gammaproteobacteria bacterium]|nr:DUF3144 domain-containing protein [Gammaproteobacteria bacterium]
MSNSNTPPNPSQGAADAQFDSAAFLKVASRFIDLANQENRTYPARDLNMALLYAAARYNAHVARAVLGIGAQEDAYVQQMTDAYRDMLRENLADPALKPK